MLGDFMEIEDGCLAFYTKRQGLVLAIARGQWLSVCVDEDVE